MENQQEMMSEKNMEKISIMCILLMQTIPWDTGESLALEYPLNLEKMGS